MYDKRIAYDRETRDYAMYLDNELIGFAANFHSAEVQLDQTVYELLIDGHFATAEALDGGAVECNEPDNHCAVHNPCPAHAADAARYLAGGILVVPIAADPAVFCSTCDGEGRIPAYGYGDQAGGYAETCPGCDGRPRDVSSAELHTMLQEIDSVHARLHPPACKMNVLGTRWTVCGAPGDGPCYCDVFVHAGPPESLRDDCLNVIDMALGSTHGAQSVVSELRRLKARLEAAAA